MREAIEKIEKASEVLAWCKENADEKWMNDHILAVQKDIDQALALITAEQPPASDFTKECRELRKKGATSEQWKYAEKMMKACDRLDSSKDGERILEERIEKLSDTLDASEASRKELVKACKRAKRRIKAMGYDAAAEGTINYIDKVIAKAAIEKQS